jgi:hypothetical protein
MASPDIVGTIRTVKVTGLERYSLFGSLVAPHDHRPETTSPQRVMHGA